jgi:hypothetical protein
VSPARELVPLDGRKELQVYLFDAYPVSMDPVLAQEHLRHPGKARPAGVNTYITSTTFSPRTYVTERASTDTVNDLQVITRLDRDQLGTVVLHVAWWML